MEETKQEISSEEENIFKKDELVVICASEHLTFKIIDVQKDKLGIYPKNKYNYNLELVEGTFIQDKLPCVPECLLVKKSNLL